MADRGSDSEYLFVVEYDSDAERKRIEYLFNNWDDGNITSPEGIVRFAGNVEHDALYKQLVAKVPEDQVDSFRIDAIQADLDPETVTIEEQINAPRDAVESFLKYMLSKKNAVLQSASHNEYEVYTKKGRAEINYRLSEDDGATTVSMQVSGYPPAPEFLGDFFETELSDYATSQA